MRPGSAGQEHAGAGALPLCGGRRSAEEHRPHARAVLELVVLEAAALLLWRTLRLLERRPCRRGQAQGGPATTVPVKGNSVVVSRHLMDHHSLLLLRRFRLRSPSPRISLLLFQLLQHKTKTKTKYLKLRHGISTSSLHSEPQACVCVCVFPSEPDRTASAGRKATGVGKN